jgi:hypothetical protein
VPAAARLAGDRRHVDLVLARAQRDAPRRPARSLGGSRISATICAPSAWRR